jgi:hypothetical protein
MMKPNQISGRLISPILLVACLGVPTFTPWRPALSAIVNGSFESGFTGWTTGGVTSIETAAFGVIPPDPINQALGTTEDGSLPTNTVGGLEDVLGIPLGVFDDPNDPFFGAATQGSAIQQTFTAQTGDTLTLDWNFLTNDTLSNDYAFLILANVNDLGTLEFSDLTQLSRANTALGSSGTSFSEETGYLTFSASIPSDGDYLIAVGVVDVGDVLGDSGVLVDNVSITSDSASVPEGNSLLGLAAIATLMVTTAGTRCLKDKMFR